MGVFHWEVAVRILLWRYLNFFSVDTLSCSTPHIDTHRQTHSLVMLILCRLQRVWWSRVKSVSLVKQTLSSPHSTPPFSPLFQSLSLPFIGIYGPVTQTKQHNVYQTLPHFMYSFSPLSCPPPTPPPPFSPPPLLPISPVSPTKDPQQDQVWDFVLPNPDWMVLYYRDKVCGFSLRWKLELQRQL